MKFLINNKHEKGITLVALIVTIIVMLILAGVTVVNLTGGEGVLERASTQKDNTKILSEKHILENAVISLTTITKKGAITEDNLRQELSNKNVEITKSGGLFRIVFKDSNNLYKMDQEGEYFYWEDMAPKTFYAKLYSDGTLIFSSDANTTYKDCYPDTETDLQPEEFLTNSYDYTKADVKKVIFHDPVVPTTCQSMFSNCSNLQEIENIENLHTENVTTMQDMFYKCSSLKSLDLKYFDTSNVTTMYRMFGLCSKITNINVISFDTSNVTFMPEIFNGCYNLVDLDVSHFNTSKQTNMYFIFGACISLKFLDLSNFDMTNVTNTDIGNMTSLITIKTPKMYPKNESLTIQLPKTFYDQEGNAYTSLTYTSPTQTWLYAK